MSALSSVYAHEQELFSDTSRYTLKVRSQTKNDYSESDRSIKFVIPNRNALVLDSVRFVCDVKFGDVTVTSSNARTVVAASVPGTSGPGGIRFKESGFSGLFQSTKCTIGNREIFIQEDVGMAIGFARVESTPKDHLSDYKSRLGGFGTTVQRKQDLSKSSKFFSRISQLNSLFHKKGLLPVGGLPETVIEIGLLNAADLGRAFAVDAASGSTAATSSDIKVSYKLSDVYLECTFASSSFIDAELKCPSAAFTYQRYDRVLSQNNTSAVFEVDCNSNHRSLRKIIAWRVNTDSLGLYFYNPLVAAGAISGMDTIFGVYDASVAANTLTYNVKLNGSKFFPETDVNTPEDLYRMTANALPHLESGCWLNNPNGDAVVSGINSTQREQYEHGRNLIATLTGREQYEVSGYRSSSTTSSLVSSLRLQMAHNGSPVQAGISGVQVWVWMLADVLVQINAGKATITF